MRVNLLPAECQFQLLLRRRTRTWFRLWAVCVFVAGCLCTWGGWKVHWMHNRLHSLTTRSEPLLEQEQRTERLRIELARFELRSGETERLLPADHTLPLMAMLSQSVSKTDGTVQVLRLAMQSSTPNSVGAKVAKDRSANLRATVHAVATDDQAVSQFVSMLRAYGVFSSVELKSSSELAGSGDIGRQFHVELRN